MKQYIRTVGTSLALTATFAFAACTVSDKSATDSSLARDSSLNKDLQLAGKDTTVQPQLQDVAATPPAPTKAPAAKPTPRPTTPAKPTTTASGNTVTRNPAGTASSSAGGAVGIIPSGTTLSLRSNERVCTNTHKVGQTFSATTTAAVTRSNGATIPAGATVQLEVTQLKRSENIRDNIVMEFAVKSISYGGRSYPVSATVASADVDKVRNQPKDKDVQKVVGGAVLGAIAGQILGKNTKSTVVGAAAGAAAGAGVMAATSNYEGCLPDGGSVAITLNSPLQVKLTS